MRKRCGQPVFARSTCAAAGGGGVDESGVDPAPKLSDEGFADQAHMGRAVKRVTGFAPAEFVRRFMDDESFWLYRLWM